MSNYLILRIYHLILPPNPRSKNLTNSQIHTKPSDENKNSKVRTIEILLDSGASALIVPKDVFYERHKILKDKKNKWSTMAGTLDTSFVTEILTFREYLREIPFNQ